jgi:hypothetical protein
LIVVIFYLLGVRLWTVDGPVSVSFTPRCTQAPWLFFIAEYSALTGAGSVVEVRLLVNSTYERDWRFDFAPQNAFVAPLLCEYDVSAE